MTIDPQKVQQAVAARLPQAQQFLCDIIARPSLPGQEAQAMEWAAQAFARLGRVEKIPMTNALKQDRDFSDPVPGIEYDGRYNLRVVQAGANRGKGKRLLLSTHIDTVPPSQGQENPFEPVLRDGAIWGRGACDAKGQVATIYLVMAALQELGVQLDGDVLGHVVCEEENGGNGTLAMVRHGEKAEGCVVLEPTDFRAITSSRGAIWFHIDLVGRTGHSGTVGSIRSAMKMGFRVVEILEGYQDRLLKESRGFELFDKYPNPMPLTVGNFHAGNWPAATPGQAYLEGVLGLLPNKTARQVMDEFTQAIKSEGGPEIANNCSIRFTYRHDCSVIEPTHELVTNLQASAKLSGREARVDAFTASCDAWYYNNQINIPTVVFGGGSLGVAHSPQEHMPVAELAAAAHTLVNLALRWCP